MHLNVPGLIVSCYCLLRGCNIAVRVCLFVTFMYNCVRCVDVILLHLSACMIALCIVPCALIACMIPLYSFEFIGYRNAVLTLLFPNSFFA